MAVAIDIHCIHISCRQLLHAPSWPWQQNEAAEKDMCLFTPWGGVSVAVQRNWVEQKQQHPRERSGLGSDEQVMPRLAAAPPEVIQKGVH